MAQNELQNILNPQDAPYLSLPPMELGPLALANIPRFQQEQKLYSVNTNAMSLLGQVLEDVIMENTITSYIDDFELEATFPGPGSAEMNVKYNMPSGLGHRNDWEIGATIPFDL